MKDIIKCGIIMRKNMMNNSSIIEFVEALPIFKYVSNYVNIDKYNSRVE